MDRHLNKLTGGLLIVAVTIALTGCMGAAAQLMYLFQGLKIEAAYDGLPESKVAVVVVTDASSYGPNTISRVLGHAMGIRLQQNVKNISVVPQNVIENWKDTHGWDEVDFRSIGEGVGAEKVIAIELSSYSIYEGSTMYKGRASITTTVYDMTNDGEMVFTQGPAQYEFPKDHARPALSTSEQQFEAVYLAKMVDTICRNFYAHDKVDAVAEDATSINLR